MLFREFSIPLIRTFLLFTLIWSAVISHAQIKMSEVDSLKQLLQKTGESRKAELLLRLSEKYYSTDLDSALYFVERARAETTDKDLEMKIGLQYASVQVERKQFDGLEVFLVKLLSYFTSTEDQKLLMKTHTVMGQYYFNQQPRRWSEAQESFLASLKLEEVYGDSTSYASSLSNYAIMLGAMDQHEASLMTYKKSLAILEKKQAFGQAVRLYFNLAFTFTGEDKDHFDLDSAIYYGKKGVSLASEIGFAMGLAKCQGVLAFPLIKKGIESPEYLEEGLKMAQASKAFFEGTPFKIDYYYGWLNEGFAYSALGSPEKAISIASDLLKTDFPDKSECHRLLHLAYKRAKKYKEALYYLELHRDYTDSVVLWNRNLIKGLNVKETAYQTEIRDQKISNLSQQAEIQSLRLSQRNFAIAGSFAFTIIIVISGVLYNQRRKAINEQNMADVEQKVLRLQMNPHFIFNALGVIQYLLREKDAVNAGKYLSKFAKLMRQTLEFSREDFILLEDELLLLENYIELQKLSTGKRFDYSIYVSDEIDPSNTKIPPMFAQPFIENAIEHGELDSFEDGKLEVKFSLDQGNMMIEVMDNGVGVLPRKTLSEQRSLATTITKERLQILQKKFHTVLSLQIDHLFPKKERKGTHMRLHVPLI